MCESLRGHFLIAGCRLRDPNFFKTAVLIVEHGPEGTMGLIINRPSSLTVAHALIGHLDLCQNKDLVYVGGPVEPEALFVVHDDPDIDPDEEAVMPGLYMGSNPSVFKSIVCTEPGDEPTVKYRVYSGCAGWGPGQLEDELARGDWMTLPAEANMVFHPNPYSVWDELLSRTFRNKRLLPQNCDHPEWN